MAEKFPENVLSVLREARETGTPVITQELADAITEAGAEIPNGVAIMAENLFDSPEMIELDAGGWKRGGKRHD